jgi:hypothetical protein
MVDDVGVGAMRLDVTVVVRNVVFGDSEYYYSRYNLRSSQPTCSSLGGVGSTASDCCSQNRGSGYCFATSGFGTMIVSMAKGQKLGSNRGGRAGGGDRGKRQHGVRG